MVATPTLDLERSLFAQHGVIISLDEVGRGALAGPVAVGAAAVDDTLLSIPMPEGLRDSKLVPERRRDELSLRARDWVREAAVGWATAAEVDDLGIIRALGLAAARAVEQVCARISDVASALVLLDGHHDYVSAALGRRMPVRAVVKGDRDCASISAASIVAKVARDEHMRELHNEYPVYEWGRNKGYASPAHRAAIRDLGLSPHHRASWAIADAPALF